MFPTATPRPRALGDVDVVEADGVVADDLEPGTGRVEEGAVHPIGQQGQDAVTTGHPAKQLVARRRELVGPQVHLADGPDCGQPLVRDDPRDEDLRPLAHTRAATSGVTSVRIRTSASSRFACEFA